TIAGPGHRPVSPCPGPRSGCRPGCARTRPCSGRVAGWRSCPGRSSGRLLDDGGGAVVVAVVGLAAELVQRQRDGVTAEPGLRGQLASGRAVLLVGLVRVA